MSASPSGLPDVAEGTASIAQRISALEEAAQLAAAYLPAERVEALQADAARASGRLRHGTHHTVVALAGPTGAGKSTLFNALIGEEVSTAGVRRPTTGRAHACVFGDEGAADAGDLLDWLAIGQRYHRDAGPDLNGLILVDLPDHDSTEEANRLEVDRLVELVDLLVWVVDPQKYADHALHAGYLRPLAGHASVMRFVLSKADTLDPASLDACLADFTSLLVDDGVTAPMVVATSISSGEATSVAAQAGPGSAVVHEMLATAVASQRSTVERLSADLSRAAGDLTDGDDPKTRRRDERAAHSDLIESLGRAAGVGRAADTVAEQHRLEAHLQTGWPVTRWVSRFQRRPIRDLPVARTSTVASAEVGLALRSAGEAAAAGLDEVWAPALRRRAERQHDAVLSALDTVSHRTISDHRRRPKWWAFAGAAQRILLGVVVASLLWLVGLAMIDGFFRIDVDLAAPSVAEVPLPTLLVFGGVALGVLGALLARVFARFGAKRRARLVRSELHQALSEVAKTHVHEPLNAALADYGRIRDLANTARGA